MTIEVTEGENSPEALARDAARWRQLKAGVLACLDDNSNGYGSIWGGDDNLFASVEYQSRGQSGMKLTLRWTALNEVREDLNQATLPNIEN